MSDRLRTAALGALILGVAGSTLQAQAPADAAPATLGQARCAQCHDAQNEWWFKDKHHDSANAILSRGVRYVQVARRYGLTPEQMTLGDRICMQCHGTAVTATRDQDVRAGVGCESCHGPAERWLEPHQQGEKSLGDRRPGYVEGVQLGLRELRQPPVLARTCLDCHLISDTELRRTGHPEGLGWNLVDVLPKLRHWDEPLADDATLRLAFAAERERRGPLQRVDRPLLASSSGLTPRPRSERRRFFRRGRSDALRPSVARALSAAVDLGDVPVFDPRAPLGQQVRQLREQLELIHDRTRERSPR